MRRKKINPVNLVNPVYFRMSLLVELRISSMDTARAGWKIHSDTFGSSPRGLKMLRRRRWIGAWKTG
jgi:hypothetical protein